MAEPASPGAGESGVGKEIYAFIEELYPLCRSITGDGVRRTLEILCRIVPLEVHEVPTGTKVLDWTVPPEWNVRDAWIKDSRGRRVVDFRSSNLHVVSYSAPVKRRISRAELEAHLHSLPERPDWIPYRTSYYHETWGFCLAHRDRLALTEPEYEVCIDATLAPGHLSYGELLLPGEREDEVLLSTHICHPSLCNDNLSGVVLACFLARHLASRANRYSHRFLLIPGTIGSITWLARNREGVGRVKHGLSLVCLGDTSPLTYKRSLRGDAEIDRVADHVLARSGEPHHVVDFSPYGYDERQFNSPGFRLEVGSLMRGRHGRFPEYHTSADDLAFVSPEQLARSFAACREILSVLDANRHYLNLSPHGEPQLGRRGLYRAMGGEADPQELELAMLWCLCLCDGSRTLLDVAERSGIAFETVRRAAELLVEHELLGEVD
jgi:aminopeptidase-like protein